MLALLVSKIISEAEDASESGGLLDGLKSVRPGNIDPFVIGGADMPCLTVALGNGAMNSPDHQRVSLKPSAVLWLYAMGEMPVATSYLQFARLLWSDDRKRGLIPWIAAHRAFKTDAGNFLLKWDGRYNTAWGGAKGIGYRHAAQFVLQLETMADIPPL